MKTINFNGNVFEAIIVEDGFELKDLNTGGLPLRNSIGMRGMLDELADAFQLNVEDVRLMTLHGTDNIGKFVYKNNTERWYDFNGFREV